METIKLDLIPGKKMPSLHASQFDDGRAYHIDLTENRVPYVLDGTETISVIIRKCDNTLVSMDIANTFGNKSYLEFEVVEQMTACSGFNYGEIILEKNGDRLGSLNFYLVVETAPDENGITSQSEIKNLARQVHDIVVEELADNGAEETGYDNTESGLEATNVQDAIDEVNAKIENIPSVDAYTKEQSDEKYATKTALEEKVDLDGEAQVTAVNLQIAKGIISPNLINPETVTNGNYIQKNGTEHSGNYYVTDYITVEAGKPYYFTWALNGVRQSGGMRFLACYDSDKTVMSDKGSDVSISTFPYIIPSGVRYLRISYVNLSGYSDFQFEQGTKPTDYKEYGTRLGSVLDDKYIDNLEIVEGQNVLNQNADDFGKGKYLNPNGNLNDNVAYNTSGYIAVKEGDNLILSYKTGGGSTDVAQMRTVCCYNENKTYKAGATGVSITRFIVPSGVFFVKVCYHFSTYGYDVQLQKVRFGEGFLPYRPYDEPTYKVNNDYLKIKKPLHIFLPPDIYCAVGRTIELYNEQILIDSGNYHIQWVCSKGNAYKRKFSITGETVGNLPLVLNVLDDEMNLVYVGRSTIHIVNASNPTKKIMPIGDSLTNWKAWLQETMLLSSNHITWLGTRYSGASEDSEGNAYPSGSIHHEGRSGWAASNYLSDSEYTFDNRYDGVAGVSGSANPFWNGSKFSLNHYLSVQTGVDAPDAVQIFLGTNDITVSVEDAVSKITALVNAIRSEFANMPIFVCNTIYRSNQNGYGSVGNDMYSGGSGANAWQYNQDIKIQDLMIGLYKALSSMSNVYLIPLATCMDREYNFGQVMTKVNPRSDVEMPMPAESIHPQASGYYQIADLLYSTYCGLLT